VSSGVPTRRPRDLRDWTLGGEALVWLGISALALRLATFEQVAAWAARRPRDASNLAGPSHDLAVRIARSVIAASRRAPWRNACFSEALACHAMLRRRGLPSRLFFGARNRGALGPVAHVWVRSGEFGLVGAETADEFALLAAYPPLPGRDPSDGES
jgi:hypothetical protein